MACDRACGVRGPFDFQDHARDLDTVLDDVALDRDTSARGQVKVELGDLRRAEQCMRSSRRNASSIGSSRREPMEFDMKTPQLSEYTAACRRRQAARNSPSTSCCFSDPVERSADSMSRAAPSAS